MSVHFSDREMQRAWRNNFDAYKTVYTPCTNAHRLLLFYAIECGLKAVLMKRNSVRDTDTDTFKQIIKEVGHNINKLLDRLNAEYSLKLPNEINMIYNANISHLDRKIDPGQINQMWRYGGKVLNMRYQNGALTISTDEDLEKCLLKISNWIRQELQP